MPMTGEELGERIMTRIAQGVPRADIVNEVKRIGLEGDPWADFELLVVQYPEPAALQTLRWPLLALRAAWSLTFTWLLGPLLAAVLLSAVGGAEAGPAISLAALVVAAGLSFGVAFRFGFRIGPGTQHGSFMLRVVGLVPLLVKSQLADVPLDLMVLGVVGLSLYIKPKLYPHVTAFGKPKSSQSTGT